MLLGNRTELRFRTMVHHRLMHPHQPWNTHRSHLKPFRFKEHLQTQRVVVRKRNHVRREASSGACAAFVEDK